MTTGAFITLGAIVGIFVGLHLGSLYLLKRGFRWVADTIDRWCGIDTSRH